MEHFNRESFVFDVVLPDRFTLSISHIESINSTYMKKMQKKLLKDYDVTDMLTKNPAKDELFGSYVFVFQKKTGRVIG